MSRIKKKNQQFPLHTFSELLEIEEKVAKPYVCKSVNVSKQDHLINPEWLGPVNSASR